MQFRDGVQLLPMLRSDPSNVLERKNSFPTLANLIGTCATQTPEASALLAPNRLTKTYQHLQVQLVQTRQHLRSSGYRTGDRVALVLPPGLDMAVAVLAVSAATTCAPLNPSYQAKEFEFYLSDLDAKALMLAQDADSPAREVARKRGLTVLEVLPSSPETGLFSLASSATTAEKTEGSVQPEDVALLLHTSGTTSRPKLVPLDYEPNLCRSGCQRLSRAWSDGGGPLPEPDAALSHTRPRQTQSWQPWRRAESVICTPRRLWTNGSFFPWLDTFRPTWYTAVPTMHQAILTQAAHYPDSVARSSLRLIRSSSSSLPLPVLHELELTFRVPVLEAYGMTEAAHQICSNPVSPGERKPGSVGLPAGPEVAVMDETGRLLGPNVQGEIVLRGANVTRGYVNNPAANAAAFTNGWFRTGEPGTQG